MIRSLKLPTLLATVYLTALCGCSALPFQRTESEEVAALPSGEGFGWRQRLERLKEQQGQPVAPAERRVASVSSRNLKKPLVANQRYAAAPVGEKRTASSSAEKSLTLGRWVKPTNNRDAVRTFDVQEPEEIEPESVAHVERPRAKKVEQPVSYDAPVQIPKTEVAAAETRATLPPIVERLAPVVNMAPVVTPDGSSLPENRLRRSSVTSSPPATVAETIEESKPMTPPTASVIESVPWQRAKFRSIDE